VIPKELKDWTLDDLITSAAWRVMDHILKGSLRDGVHEAVLMALRWNAAQKEQSNGE
jgi:anthranilate phosphoribosyltransferase